MRDVCPQSRRLGLALSRLLSAVCCSAALPVPAWRTLRPHHLEGLQCPCSACCSRWSHDALSVRAQAEVTRLRRERAELEDRAEEAEGGLAAAQTDMETSRKRLEAELAATRTEARRAAEEVQLGHSSEVCARAARRLLFMLAVLLEWCIRHSREAATPHLAPHVEVSPCNAAMVSSVLQATVVRSELEKLKREHEQLTAELSKVHILTCLFLPASFHPGVCPSSDSCPPNPLPHGHPVTNSQMGRLPCLNL